MHRHKHMSDAPHFSETCQICTIADNRCGFSRGVVVWCEAGQIWGQVSDASGVVVQPACFACPNFVSSPCNSRVPAIFASWLCIMLHSCKGVGESSSATHVPQAHNMSGWHVLSSIMCCIDKLAFILLRGLVSLPKICDAAHQTAGCNCTSAGISIHLHDMIICDTMITASVPPEPASLCNHIAALPQQSLIACKTAPGVCVNQHVTTDSR